MTQYATVTDLNAVGVSVEITASLGSTLDAILTTRSAYADSYVGASGKYVLPLTAWGADLRLAVAQLSAWDIMTALVGFNPETPAGAVWMTRRDEAQRWLEGVAAERIAMVGVIDSSTTPTEDTGIMVLSDSPRGWGFRC